MRHLDHPTVKAPYFRTANLLRSSLNLWHLLIVKSLLVGFWTSAWVAQLVMRCLPAAPSCNSIALLLRVEGSENTPLVSLVTCRWVSKAGSRRFICLSSYWGCTSESRGQIRRPMRGSSWELHSRLLRWHGDVFHHFLACRGSRSWIQVIHFNSSTAVSS